MVSIKKVVTLENSITLGSHQPFRYHNHDRQVTNPYIDKSTSTDHAITEQTLHQNPARRYSQNTTPNVHKVPLQKKEHPVHYEFEYSVHDTQTHDIKEQKEYREGDTVKGMYYLIEPDGSKRIVEYTADKNTGFQAVVRREPGPHPSPKKFPTPAKASAANLVAQMHRAHQ